MALALCPARSRGLHLPADVVAIAPLAKAGNGSDAPAPHTCQLMSYSLEVRPGAGPPHTARTARADSRPPGMQRCVIAACGSCGRFSRLQPARAACHPQVPYLPSAAGSLLLDSGCGASSPMVLLEDARAAQELQVRTLARAFLPPDSAAQCA
jgi:hypothetical protein